MPHCFGLSLVLFPSSPGRLPFCTSLSLTGLFLSFPCPNTPYRILLQSSSSLHGRTSDLHPKKQGQASAWSTPLRSWTSHLPSPLTPSPADTLVHTRRSIRQEPLQISRNIPWTLLIRPDFLHTGWRDPSIILSVPASTDWIGAGGGAPLCKSAPHPAKPPAHKTCQLVSSRARETVVKTIKSACR